jgi:prepilin-type N-terminal cleavage/methylation domain-containing protein
MKKNKRTHRKKTERGFSLIEMLVVVAMFSVITTCLVIFYQSADVEFSQSMSTMSLSSTARMVATKVIPYASTAVPSSSTGTTVAFIYSPAQGSINTDPTTLPNIYNLDFSTGNDLLLPVSTTNTGGMSNCRGTVNYYRYRIRFDPTLGNLWLEEVDPTIPYVAGQATPNLSAPYNPDGQHAPRLLGKNIAQMSFNNDNNAIQMTITVDSVLRNGKFIDGTIHRAMQGKVKNSNAVTTAVGNTTRGSEYTLFSTIFIPYYSGQ